MPADCHIHLRGDDDCRLASASFDLANVERYVEAAAEAGVSEIGFSEHVYRFKQALDVWRHPFWIEQARDDLDEYFAFLDDVRTRYPMVRAGLECDWVPGRESEIETLLSAYDWDFVLGAVHFIGDFSVDMEEFSPYGHLSVEEVWSRYFDEVGAAAASGLYDVLAHPDLVRVFGTGAPVPEGDPSRYFARAYEGIERSDVAIEVSTAGRRKRLGEIYPHPAFLSHCFATGTPITVASDAHSPEYVGYLFDEAIEYARSAGYRTATTFERRKRRQVEL